MNTTTVTDLSQLIHLKDFRFQSYELIYHINDGYFIDDFSKFISKHQLLFQRFGDIRQQHNLMVVDSIFPVTLADLVLDVLLNKAKTMDDYLHSLKSIVIIDANIELSYFNRKLNDFLEQLLYSYLSHESELEVGKRDFSKIFCRKYNCNEMEYFTLYERYALYDVLKKEMKLEIDYTNSKIVDTEAHVWLKMGLD